MWRDHPQAHGGAPVHRACAGKDSTLRKGRQTRLSWHCAPSAASAKKSVPPYGVKAGDSADPLDGVHAPVGPEFDPRTGHARVTPDSAGARRMIQLPSRAAGADWHCVGLGRLLALSRGRAPLFRPFPGRQRGRRATEPLHRGWRRARGRPTRTEGPAGCRRTGGGTYAHVCGKRGTGGGHATPARLLSRRGPCRPGKPSRAATRRCPGDTEGRHVDSGVASRGALFRALPRPVPPPSATRRPSSRAAAGGAAAHPRAGSLAFRLEALGASRHRRGGRGTGRRPARPLAHAERPGRPAAHCPARPSSNAPANGPRRRARPAPPAPHIPHPGSSTLATALRAGEAVLGHAGRRPAAPSSRAAPRQPAVIVADTCPRSTHEPPPPGRGRRGRGGAARGAYSGLGAVVLNARLPPHPP